MSDTLPDTSLWKDGNCSTAQMQEFNDVKEFFKMHYKEYTKYKILHEAVEDTQSDASCLDPELKTKIQDVILGHSCAQVTELEDQSFDTLLGLPDLKNTVLSYNESVKLKKSVLKSLESKHEHVCESLSDIFGENANSIKSSDNFGELGPNSNDRALCELKNKLAEQQRRYLENLLEEHEILEKMTSLRVEQLPKVCENKVTECQVKSRMAALRSKMVQEKTRVDIFAGTSNSLSAYKELMNDIREQQEECRMEIQYLEQLKEKYGQVACKQYSGMLKSYIQYKSSLDKKKMIYDSLYR